MSEIENDTFHKNANENNDENIDSSKLPSEFPELQSWEDMNVESSHVMQILRGIYAYGFENPSPIQQKALPPMLLGRDLIAQAQSGTGKTGAFTTGCLNLINPDEKMVQAIIMSPTRELAMQTKGVCEALGSFLKNFNIILCVGGDSVDKNIKDLAENKPQIVCGCPGRIHDMIRRNAIQSKNIKVMVLDEADEMLSTGFKEQVYNIFQFMPKDIQLCLFSATIPNDCAELTKKFMRDPVKILVSNENLTLEGITQYKVCVEDDQQKYATLKDLYGALSVSQCIIYCNSVKRVKDLYNALLEDGYPACCIHSSMEKAERTEAYKDFKSGKSRVLVSSNVTARGIDIQQVSIVINFDVPKCVHTYLHRIGRSGRWGRKGMGINFVTARDSRYTRNIEQHYSCKLEELPATFVSGNS
tara:strand:+ start:1967 stop:3211 length:1245 start_codon:yes stop_codon:yes gene_type:complete